MLIEWMNLQWKRILSYCTNNHADPYLFFYYLKKKQTCWAILKLNIYIYTSDFIANIIQNHAIVLYL